MDANADSKRRLTTWLLAKTQRAVVSISFIAFIIFIATAIPATNIVAAVQAPSTPTNVIAVPVTSAEIRVSWTASQSSIGIAGYNVYQDGKLVSKTTGTRTAYTVTGLLPPTQHTYTISAYDTAGDVSNVSTGVNASIPLGGIKTYDQTILADHPVAFWDVNPLSTTEPDLTGNSNKGIYKNGLPMVATMPNGDGAADFDSNGSSQYLTIPSNASLSISTTGSLTWKHGSGRTHCNSRKAPAATRTSWGSASTIAQHANGKGGSTI